MGAIIKKRRSGGGIIELIIYTKKLLNSDWLRARALLLVFEKLTRAYLFQIALEIM